MKIREGIHCGGSSVQLSLTDDDQDCCYTKTKGKFNAGDLLEWSIEDFGNCSSANVNLKSTKVSLLSSDINFCPEYLTVRTDHDNLWAVSYKDNQTYEKSLTGKRSYMYFLIQPG